MQEHSKFNKTCNISWLSSIIRYSPWLAMKIFSNNIILNDITKQNIFKITLNIQEVESKKKCFISPPCDKIAKYKKPLSNKKNDQKISIRCF